MFKALVILHLVMYDELVVMLGNMWSLYHFIPVSMAMFCVLGDVDVPMTRVAEGDVDDAGDGDGTTGEVLSIDSDFSDSGSP